MNVCDERWQQVSCSDTVSMCCCLLLQVFASLLPLFSHICSLVCAVLVKLILFVRFGTHCSCSSCLFEFVT